MSEDEAGGGEGGGELPKSKEEEEVQINHSSSSSHNDDPVEILKLQLTQLQEQCNNTHRSPQRQEAEVQTEPSSSDISEEVVKKLKDQLVKLQEHYDGLSKSKETVVMRYANSEKDVIKLKRELDNSDKQIKNLMRESEALSQKNKQLVAEKQRLTQQNDSKGNVAEDENKKLRARVEELQNELKSAEITKSQFSRDFAQEKLLLQRKYDDAMKENAGLEEKLEELKDEVEKLKEKSLQCDEMHSIQKECDKLKEELASKEFIIKWTQDRVLSLECECEQIRHNNAEVLNDMSISRSKEIELLAYTQQVTEKNVSLQSKISSVEAKITALEEDNKKLSGKLEATTREERSYEKVLSTQKAEFEHEKKSLLDQIESQNSQIVLLQQQLDETRGEISVMKKKHESTLKELSRELRRQMRDNTSVEGISLGSRTSSCSSLNTLETTNNSKAYKGSETVIHEPQALPQVDQTTVLPDQQVLIERILKLQKALVKKQEKIDFLQDHGNQLVDELQKKCKIIQCYAMSQDPGALSSNRSDENKAEVVKHGGVMASLFASRSSDESLTYELLLEINNKLQAVLEDSLLKNITLKENISTLGAEIFKLQKENKELEGKLQQR